MKSGDTVTIKDYSYVRSVSHGKLTLKRPNCVDDADRQYTVVETGCSFPLFSLQPTNYRNDTVIQTDDGRVVFIHSRFLKLVNPPHVWKHGDVFKNGGGFMMYVHPNHSNAQMFWLRRSWRTTCSIAEYRKNATFLFNIKDKLPC